MDLAAYYYRECVGIYPFATNREEAITRHTIAYMLESGLTEAEVFGFLNSIGGEKGFVTPADIPAEAWDESLLDRGQYYCHSRLQLLSPMPIIRSDGTFKEYPFYQEMRIRFTIKDLVDYFYEKIPGYTMLRDDKRDEAQFRHMLKKYRNMHPIQALDIILLMIDEAAYQNVPVVEPFDIKTTFIQQDVVDRLQKTLAECHAKGYDKNIWRTYLIDEQGEITWQTKQK